jgi:hypothetical protein
VSLPGDYLPVDESHLADCEYAAVLRRIARTVGLREGFSFEAVEERVASLKGERERLRAALCSIHGFQCGCEWPGDPKACIALPSEDFAVLGPKRPTSIGATMRGE